MTGARCGCTDGFLADAAIDAALNGPLAVEANDPFIQKARQQHGAQERHKVFRIGTAGLAQGVAWRTGFGCRRDGFGWSHNNCVRRMDSGLA